MLDLAPGSFKWAIMGKIHRAINLVMALALVVTGRNGGLGATAAEVWVAVRILYVPLYFIQIPFARSLVWFVSIFALVSVCSF